MNQRSILSLISVLVIAMPLAALAGSQNYTTPGSYSFTVPSYGTLTVQVWGAGQHGGIGTILYGDQYATPGAGSTFNNTLIAGGGGTVPGQYISGGSASGGDVNTPGNMPIEGYGNITAIGGSAPNGGIGGFSPNMTANPNGNGVAPGGGGGCSGGIWWLVACFGGGSGGYVEKTYNTGDLTAGASIPVVVGAGDTSTPNAYGTGYGGNGAVNITWTASTSSPSTGSLSCSLVTNPTAASSSQTQTLSWSSTGQPNDFFIQSIGDVSNSGSAVVPSGTYTGTVYSCPTGSTLSANRTQCVIANTSNAGSQTYTTPGSYSFTVPQGGYGTLTVQAWGGGQHSAIGSILYGDQYGTFGGNSTFNGTLIAGGGGGVGGQYVSGGSASGGDVNIPGNLPDWSVDPTHITAVGGSAPNGGIGGYSPNMTANPNWNGVAPGGGGGCSGGIWWLVACLGGGSGGYVEKAYNAGDLTAGASIPVVVGAGGQNTPIGTGGGAGGDGAVNITWTASSSSPNATPQTATCSSASSSNTCIPQTDSSGNVIMSCQADGNIANSCGTETSCGGYGCSTTTNQCNPNTCTLSDTCGADGNLYNACTGTLTQVCAAGCNQAGQCISAQCVPTNICGSDGNLHNSCTSAMTNFCLFGCSGSTDTCNTVPPGIVGSFTVKPTLVKKGTQVKVSWSTSYMKTCAVSNTATSVVWTELSATDTLSDPIQGQTTFTLSCTDLLNGTASSQSQVVNVVPAFNEL